MCGSCLDAGRAPEPDGKPEEVRPGIVSGAWRRRGLAGAILIGTGVLACPCHLPLTLPLLAGTAIGAFALGHPLLVVGGLGLYFLAAIFFGARLLGTPRQ